MAVALPWIGLALSAVGTGVAAYSAHEQGEAAEKAGEYNAKVAENSATAAQYQAQHEASRIRKQHLRLLGKQRSGYAKAGVDFSGSAVDVIMDSSQEAELDVLAALWSGNLHAGYQQSKAKLSRMQGGNAARAGTYQAAGTLLTGGSRIATQAAPYFGED